MFISVLLLVLFIRNTRSYHFEDKFYTWRVFPQSRRLLGYNLSNQSPEEANYLRFHRCNNEGEVYAAAYLITKEHVLQHIRITELEKANTEGASFAVMAIGAGKNEIRSGLMVQALDVFDFSVIHLSAYERLLRRNRLPENMQSFKPLAAANDELHRARHKRIHVNSTFDEYLNKTVVIFPFLMSETGVGNSKTRNRALYLNSTFWSFYAYIPNIVVAVKSAEDYNYVRSCGLPFYEIMFLQTIPTSASLPMAAIVEAQKKLQTGAWKFGYMFFTESDQILLMREEAITDIYSFLNKYPRRVVIPHRLIPYPPELFTSRLKRPLPPSANYSYTWNRLSCCMPRQNCEKERTDWVGPANDALKFAEIYSTPVALSNCNFHRESCRPCRSIVQGRVDVCP